MFWGEHRPERQSRGRGSSCPRRRVQWRCCGRGKGGERGRERGGGVELVFLGGDEIGGHVGVWWR